MSGIEDDAFARKQRLERRVDHQLDRSSDGINMEIPAEVVSSTTVYTGRIFHVDDMVLALTDKRGGKHEISRQVLRHAPCVVMLVHDMSTDRYLIEREYRAGSDMFAYGLPAGLMDEGEDMMDAALRELSEETGVVPDRDVMGVDYVGAFYSSEGMTDELAHVMVLHLGPFKREARHFDADEHVESAWIPWSDLVSMSITASNSMIAIQHEALRRLMARHADDKDKPTLFA